MARTEPEKSPLITGPTTSVGRIVESVVAPPLSPISFQAARSARVFDCA